MYLRKPITRYQLSRIAHRITNILNSEAVFMASQIQLWRSMADNDPVKALSEIADSLKTLRIETLKSYEIPYRREIGKSDD